MVALGLLILAAAGVVGAVGVLGNDGAAHPVSPAFEVLGFEFTGSAGHLFFYGMLVGIAGTIGLGLVVVGSRRRVRHRVGSWRERREIRGETQSLQQEAGSLQEERDRLARELAAEREQHAADAAASSSVSVSEDDRGTFDPGDHRPAPAMPAAAAPPTGGWSTTPSGGAVPPPPAPAQVNGASSDTTDTAYHRRPPTS